MNHFSIRSGNPIQEITALYNAKKEAILKRLDEFKKLWETGTRKEIFAELVFCLLTPMARGRSCFIAVENMVKTGILFTGDTSQITQELIGARFIHKKSAYIVEARERFLCNGKGCIRSKIREINDGPEAREWLAQNVKGLGYKEASHFLRNIGFEQNLAILDRHVVKNLKLMRVIEEIPDSLSKRRYLDLEKKMVDFSRAIKIPMSHLDLIMWYKETGEILK